MDESTEIEQLAEAAWAGRDDSWLSGPWSLLRDTLGASDRKTRRQAAADLASGHSRETEIIEDYTGRYPIELLQNAQDAAQEGGLRQATVWMHVSDDALLVGNEGEPFDEDRLSGLVNTALSSKVEHHTIGYKGIGFTSVFEITDRPQVFSGGYEFSLDSNRALELIQEHFEEAVVAVPRRRFAFPVSKDDLGSDRRVINRMVRDGAVTVVRLPLAGRAGDAESIRAYLDETLAPEVLLFMPAVGTLKISGQGKARTWSRSTGRRSHGGRLVMLENERRRTEAWLTYSDEASIPPELAESLPQEVWKQARAVTATVAVPWSRGKPDPTRASRPLHVYFPTLDSTGRKVLIHGDFYVHSDRTRIHTADPGKGVTDIVGAMAAELVSSMATELATMGLPLLRCLAPLERSDGYGTALNELIDERLGEAEFLRTPSGEVARAEDLQQLGADLAPEDARRLGQCHDDSAHLLHPDDGVDPEVTDWLHSLGLHVAKAEDVLAHFNPDRSSATYDALLQTLERYAELRRLSRYQLMNRRVVRTQDGRWVTPTSVARRVEGIPRLPDVAKVHVLDLPRTPPARRFIERLGISDLDARETAEAVITVASRAHDDATSRELLVFLHRLWRAHRVELRDVVADEVLVPCTTARGTAVHWRSAGAAYFSRAWTEDGSLEQLFGSLRDAEFLSDNPFGDGQRDLRFFTWLGVSKEPRFDLKHSVTMFPYDLTTSPWGASVGLRAADPCTGHPETARRVDYPWLDRFEDLISGSRTGRAHLARFLGTHATTLLKDATVRCTSQGHGSGRSHGSAEGRLAWMVRTSSWLPSVDENGRKVDLPPEHVWIEPPDELPSHALPLADIPDVHADALGCGDPRRPSVASLVAGLERLRLSHEDLEQAGAAVQSTADWMFNRLHGALRSRRTLDTSFEVPAWSSAGRRWSEKPLVADLDGLEYLDGIEWVPAIGNANTYRALGLARASDVVKARAIPAGAVRRDDVLTEARRCQLYALLYQQTDDPGRLGFRLSRLNQISADDLDVELEYKWRKVRVDQPVFLKELQNARGSLDGGVLYLGRTWPEVPRLVADRLARYLDEVDLVDRILHFLADPEATLNLHEVDERSIADASTQLRKRPRRRLTEAEETALVDVTTEDGADLASASESHSEAPPGTSGVDDEAGLERVDGASSGDQQQRTGDGEGDAPAVAAAAKAKPPARKKTASARRKQPKLITIVPPPGMPASTADHSTTEGRSRSDKGGIAAVLEYERSAGRYPREMPHGNKGYDIESYATPAMEGQVSRYIEVKSLAGRWAGDYVKVSKAQLEFANGPNGPDSWLYVVERAQSDAPNVHAMHRIGSRAEGFYFDHGWSAFSEDPQVTTESVLDDILYRFDERVEPLLRELLRLGAAVPLTIESAIDDLPGFDEGWLVEAGWPADSVAVVTDENPDRDEYLHAQGWSVFRHVEVSVAALSRSLGLAES